MPQPHPHSQQTNKGTHSSNLEFT
jgi:hypothetical protein